VLGDEIGPAGLFNSDRNRSFQTGHGSRRVRSAGVGLQRAGSLREEAAVEVDAMSLSRNHCSTPCPRCLLRRSSEKREREEELQFT
jgi:hypothetical protein